MVVVVVVVVLVVVVVVVVVMFVDTSILVHFAALALFCPSFCYTF